MLGARNPAFNRQPDPFEEDTRAIAKAPRRGQPSSTFSVPE